MNTGMTHERIYISCALLKKSVRLKVNTNGGMSHIGSSPHANFPIFFMVILGDEKVILSLFILNE